MDLLFFISAVCYFSSLLLFRWAQYSSLFIISFFLVVRLSVGFFVASEDYPLFFASDWYRGQAILSFSFFISFIIIFSFFLKRHLAIDKDRLRAQLTNFSGTRLSNFILIITILLLLPLWASIGIKNTGFYSLFSDPATHLLLRDQSYKSLDSSLYKTLYSYGSLLSIPSQIILFCRATLCRNSPSASLPSWILLFLFLILSNINGSRGGFLLPFVYCSLLLFISSPGFELPLLRFKLSTSLLKRTLLISGLAIGLFFLALIITNLRQEYNSNRLLIYQINAIMQRVFGSPFFTAVHNLYYMDSIRPSLHTVLGGFPGASFIFGGHESIYMIIGRLHDLDSGIRFESSNNMNTSGLFLYTHYAGPFLGSFIYSSLALFWSYLLSSFARSNSPQSCFLVTSVYVPSAWIISQSPFSIGVVFPLVLLFVLYNLSTTR